MVLNWIVNINNIVFLHISKQIKLKPNQLCEILISTEFISKNSVVYLFNVFKIHLF